MKKETLKKIILILTAIAILPAASAGQDSLRICLQKGGKGLMDKQFKKAVINYSNALKIDSANFEALRNLGVALSALGDQEGAKRSFQKALIINPTDPDLNNNIGAMYSNDGNREKAIEYFENAVRADSNKALHLTHLGQEYSKTGRIGRALPLFRRADSLEPGNSLVLFSMGNCFAATKSYDSANYYYEKSKEAGGQSPELFYFLGRIKQHLGDLEAAEDNYFEAVTRNVKYREALHSLGLVQMQSRRYAEAAERFREVVDIDSTFYPGWMGLGASLSLNGMIPESQEVLNRLFAVDSSLGFKMLKIISTEYKKSKQQKK